MTKEVTVYPLPDVAFVAENACDGKITTFVNQTTIGQGRVVSYLWDFGDGTNSVEAAPVKQFLNPGAYPVKLRATSDKGCTDEITQMVIVDVPPIANFTATNVCLGGETVFTNQSSITTGSLTYAWYFGDGQTSIATSPRHTYREAGVYEAMLVATSEAGCRDTLYRYVEVFAAPIIAISPDTTVSRGYPVRLRASGGEQYVWEPAVGLDDINSPTPLARPAETTTYTVTVTNERGCVSTAQVTVTIEDDFKVVASNVLTPDDNGQNDTWTISNIDVYEHATVQVFDRWGNKVYEQANY